MAHVALSANNAWNPNIKKKCLLRPATHEPVLELIRPQYSGQFCIMRFFQHRMPNKRLHSYANLGKRTSVFLHPARCCDITTPSSPYDDRGVTICWRPRM